LRNIKILKCELIKSRAKRKELLIDNIVLTHSFLAYNFRIFSVISSFKTIIDTGVKDAMYGIRHCDSTVYQLFTRIVFSITAGIGMWYAHRRHPCVARILRRRRIFASGCAGRMFDSLCGAAAFFGIIISPAGSMLSTAGRAIAETGRTLAATGRALEFSGFINNFNDSPLKSPDFALYLANFIQFCKEMLIQINRAMFACAAYIFHSYYNNLHNILYHI
jgi:hypothetical protein